MDHFLSELFIMTYPSWVALHITAHRFTELHKPHCHKKSVIHEEKIRLTMFFVAKDIEALYSQQKQYQLLTSSDHELLTVKFRLKLKKIGKTTRPFRYDLIKILYTIEVTNRFKGLDLIDRVPEELWTEVHNIV